MLKSYKAGFYIKTPRVSVIKCVKMAKNRGIFFIYVKTFYYFFQNFYVLIGGFEVHSLRYMQKNLFGNTALVVMCVIREEYLVMLYPNLVIRL